MIPHQIQYIVVFLFTLYAIFAIDDLALKILAVLLGSILTTALDIKRLIEIMVLDREGRK